jgi:MFS family permease
MKDSVAAVYTLAWSIGDWLGPFLGGLLEQVVPLWPEARCAPPRKACSTAFPVASAAYGLLLLCTWVLVAAAVPREGPGVEGEADGEGGGEESRRLVVRASERMSVGITALPSPVHRRQHGPIHRGYQSINHAV